MGGMDGQFCEWILKRKKACKMHRDKKGVGN